MVWPLDLRGFKSHFLIFCLDRVEIRLKKVSFRRCLVEFQAVGAEMSVVTAG